MSEAEPRLCVAVATHNRRDAIGGALESVVDQLAVGDELLVVDSGSEEATAEYIRSWLDDRYPAGRLLREPDSGISVARNRVLAETEAPIVCFIDDDVRAEREWLSVLRACWLAAPEKTAVIGGPMLPDWQAARPPWLADHLLYVLAVLDLGPEARRLDQTPGRGYVWGGNMSLRVDAVRAVGGFDPNRGARPDAPYDRGEEEELQRSLVRAGWEIWYEPGSRVRHIVPAERVTKTHFREVFRRRGLSEAARGVPRRAGLSRLARGAAAYVLARLRKSPRAEAAAFTVVHGWSLLTAPRR